MSEPDNRTNESIVVVQPSTAVELEIALRLDELCRANNGSGALNAAARADLQLPGPHSTAVIAYGPTADPVGLAQMAPNANFRSPHFAASVVAVPTAPADILTSLMRGLVDACKADGGGHIVCWIDEATDHTNRLARDAGFEVERVQHRLSVGLPVDATTALPTGTTIRSFVPDQDEEVWLEVNNSAFGNHPDQGDWTEANLVARMGEEWFDPEGFLLAFDNRGLGGFCWTKVHNIDDDQNRLGEIFVIGVEPTREGTGLARALVINGLRYLARVQGCDRGMLHVDAANKRALKLYKSLGFGIDYSARAYGIEVSTP